ncbi:hypothetical protein EV2_018503 [Malus domestica]
MKLSSQIDVNQEVGSSGNDCSWSLFDDLYFDIGYNGFEAYQEQDDPQLESAAAEADQVAMEKAQTWHTTDQESHERRACKSAKEHALKNGPIILEMDIYRAPASKLHLQSFTYKASVQDIQIPPPNNHYFGPYMDSI